MLDSCDLLKASLKTETFWHLTDVCNVPRILSQGLKGGTKARNRNHKPDAKTIYALSVCDRRVMDSVAINQLWIDENIERYAVIAIDANGLQNPKPPIDGCNESTMVYQRAIQQNLIKPEFLRLESIVDLNWPGYTLRQAIAQLEYLPLNGEQLANLIRYWPHEKERWLALQAAAQAKFDKAVAKADKAVAKRKRQKRN